MFGLIKRPVFTRKTTGLLEKYNHYIFDVDPKLTKPQIQKIVEEIFSVQVQKVNTYSIPNRKRRLKNYVGSLTRFKRAIVTLKAIEKIIIYPSINFYVLLFFFLHRFQNHYTFQKI
jgi:large subunit ribosomal protein L23